MPVSFKDYYAILEVSKEASEDEIKKAFRKLARKHHPDVAADKDKAKSEDRFKEINEAYEVLGDPVKRQKYDTLGARWNEPPMEGPAPGQRWKAGPGEGGAQEFHFDGTGFSDFFEQFFGGSMGGRAHHGYGTEAGFDPGPGPARSQSYRGQDIEGDILVTLDEVLNGTLRPLALETVNPQTGRRSTSSFTVRIPPGAPEGKRIRVSGHGGAGGNGGPAGDLFLRVRYAAHPDFRVRGADLYLDLDLAPWEAVLGTEVQVAGLQGSIKVRVPPGTGQGARLRLKGQGLPQGKSGERGDLFVVIQIQVPTQVNPEEKVLWENLASGSAFRARPQS
jgi:curved DNA-binding protein